MNIAILNQLREANGHFLPLESFGGDVESAREAIEELERFGFGVEWHPYLGVAYRAPAKRLCPDQIEHELGTTIIGRRVAVWNRVGSTNDLAANASHSLANEGLVVLAEEQNQGRGQRGRKWTSPPSTSLLMSILIFPTGELAESAWLIALAALAVADVVAEVTGCSARIKWPNDVRVDRKKVAGILVERGQGAVIGIGLNVNLLKTDFPNELRAGATSLQILKGSIAILDRSEIARNLIRNLDLRYRSSLEGGPLALARDWCQASEHLERLVAITTPSGRFEGRLTSLDFDRGMVLDDSKAVELKSILAFEEL